MIKCKSLQWRLLYPARLSFKVEEEIESFPDKKKLKVFVNTKLVWQQMLKSCFRKKEEEEEEEEEEKEEENKEK